jgi:hypothetical protein
VLVPGTGQWLVSCDVVDGTGVVVVLVVVVVVVGVVGGILVVVVLLSGT